MLDKYYKVTGKDFAFAGTIDDADRLMNEVDEAITILRTSSPKDLAECERFLKTNTVLKSISAEMQRTALESESIGDKIKSLFEQLINMFRTIWKKIMGALKSVFTWLGLIEEETTQAVEEITDTVEVTKKAGLTIVREATSNVKNGIVNASSSLINRASNFVERFRSKTGKADPLPAKMTNEEVARIVKKTIDTIKNDEKSSEVQSALASVSRELEYRLTEEQWDYFGYNKRYKPFSPELADHILSAADYGYRLCHEYNSSFSAKHFFDIIQSTLNSINLDGEKGKVKRTFAIGINKKIAEILDDIVQSDLRTNVSFQMGVVTGKKVDFKDYIEEPIEKFTKVISENMSYRVSDANKDLFIPYNNQTVPMGVANTYVKALAKTVAHITETADMMQKIANAREYEVSKLGNFKLSTIVGNSPNRVALAAELIQDANNIFKTMEACMTKIFISNMRVSRNIIKSVDTQLRVLRTSPIRLMGD